MKDTTIRQEIQQAVIVDNRNLEAVAGLELGDKNSWLIRLERDGTVSLRCSIRTSRSALTKYFSKQKRLRVVIEAGSHSNWIAQLLERLGHEVIVAHPRQLKLMSESLSKNDRRDAGLLAELGLTSPKLLAPARPRSRQVLVGARTKLINSVRGQMKIFGLRVSQGEAATFAARARAELPKDLTTALGGRQADGWIGGGGFMVCWARKSRGSQNRDSRYGSSEILGWQVGDLEGARRDWVCLVFFVLLAGWVVCWLAERGRGDGGLVGAVHLGAGHSGAGLAGTAYAICVLGAFASSLPQVGGVSDGLPVDVVVRASLR